MDRSSSDLRECRESRRQLGSVVIFFAYFLSICVLSSCVKAPTDDARTANEVVFLDLPKFDKDLSAALSRHKNTVAVDFYEPVSPNQVPIRLQNWISSAEKSGGKISVIAPPSDPVPKSPMLAANLLSGLWSSLKLLDDFRKDKIYDAAANRDVMVSLDRDIHGQVVVKRVIFSMREMK